MKAEELTKGENEDGLQLAEPTITHAEEMSSASDYIFKLSMALDDQEKKLTEVQSEVKNMLGAKDQLLAEYNLSVNSMKNKLEERRNRLDKSKE